MHTQKIAYNKNDVHTMSSLLSYVSYGLLNLSKSKMKLMGMMNMYVLPAMTSPSGRKIPPLLLTVTIQ
jgi:hypothetical protein